MDHPTTDAGRPYFVLEFQFFFSADGRLLVSSSEDDTIRSWDAQTDPPAVPHEIDVRVSVDADSGRFSSDSQAVIGWGHPDGVR